MLKYLRLYYNYFLVKRKIRVAAAMSSEQNLFPAAIPVSALQYELQKTGGIMHIDNGYPLKNKGTE